MKADIKDVKTTILGIQGSGKTVLAKSLIKQFKNPLVYGVHLYEWEKEPAKITVYQPRDYSLETFDLFAKELIDRKKKGEVKYDALIIDEADMFFRNNFNIHPHVNDLFINHRHYGIALVFITRRPQDISTKIYEQSEHLFIFAIEGVNVKRYLLNLHEEMTNLLSQLHKDKHNFIYKRIGETPKLLKAVKTK